MVGLPTECHEKQLSQWQASEDVGWKTVPLALKHGQQADRLAALDRMYTSGGVADVERAPTVFQQALPSSEGHEFLHKCRSLGDQRAPLHAGAGRQTGPSRPY